ncbi:hypothetical protein SNE40_004385 [Patella caerulea]|uniref:E3 ubiquitin-protein ligase n=1 Tax=Patella caerulea TaxID=87958 RepID=A0AAN8K978_PATCE
MESKGTSSETKSVDSKPPSETVPLPTKVTNGAAFDSEEDSEESEETDKQTEKDEASNSPDCPVCLQPSIHPVQLPCRHIFCFLCVKGVANRSRKCALCRQVIPPDFFLHPTLVRKEDLEHTVTFDDAYQWFYEGANGWWQYDDRTSVEIENHFKKQAKGFELLIAGYMYIIDFENMVQCRRNDRTKKRRIKRDLVNMPNKKGIAGLKIGNTSSDQESDRPGGDGNEAPVLSLPGGQQVPIPIVRIDRRGGGYDTSLSPPTPSNTPQTPQTPSESPPTSSSTERDLSVHLERLHLGDGSRVSSSPPRLPLAEEYQRISGRDTTRLNAVHSRLQELESDIYNQVEDDASTPTGETSDNYYVDCDTDPDKTG